MNHLFDWQYVDDARWRALLERGVELSVAGARWEKRAASKSIGLVFFNPSLRTRASMDLACTQLGGHALSLEPGQGSWGMEFEPGAIMNATAAEHVVDGFGVLSRYFDALGVRIFAAGKDYAADRDERVFKRILEASKVPIINLESAFYHPCQALADAVTLQRQMAGACRGKKFVLQWCHHPKALPMAVPNSTLLMATRMGFDVTLAHPPGFELDNQVVSLAGQYADQHQTELVVEQDLATAVADAEVIYAKAWGGQGAYVDPAQEAQDRGSHKNWRVTADTMAATKDAVCMHPLPVRRNVVIDDAVLDGPRAVHLDQAENRIHAQKAVLEYVWGLE